jgi:hypothetical protein
LKINKKKLNNELFFTNLFYDGLKDINTINIFDFKNPEKYSQLIYNEKKNVCIGILVRMLNVQTNKIVDFQSTNQKSMIFGNYWAANEYKGFIIPSNPDKLNLKQKSDDKSNKLKSADNLSKSYREALLDILQPKYWLRDLSKPEYDNIKNLEDLASYDEIENAKKNIWLIIIKIFYIL